MTGLLDTNAALFLLGGRLAEPLPAGDYGVSVITEMELLAWPSLTSEEETKARAFSGQLSSANSRRKSANALSNCAGRTG